MVTSRQPDNVVVMEKLADSARIPEGVRFSELRDDGSEAVDALYALVCAMCGGEFHPVLHDALYISLPMASAAEDGIVHLQESRRIVVKIATVVGSNAVSPVVAANAASEQRGVAGGRTLVDNIWIISRLLVEAGEEGFTGLQPEPDGETRRIKINPEQKQPGHGERCGKEAQQMRPQRQRQRQRPSSRTQATNCATCSTDKGRAMQDQQAD